MASRPRVEILGPVTLRAGGVAQPIGGRSARLLVALALSDGTTLDQLAEAVWSGDPPPTHRPALHVHLGNLRRMLAAAAPGGGVVRTGDRYALDRTTWDVDAEIAASLVDAARGLAESEPDRAAVLAEEALRLWRGVPATVGGEVVHPVALHQLDALRRSTEELHVDCLLAAGAADRAEAAAMRLVAEEPLREHRWGQLLRARYLAGRTADAVATYQEARRHLGDALGIEPGHDLRSLEAAALTHDRARLGIPQPAAADGRWRPPPVVGALVGRARSTDRVATLVASGTPVLVTGPPGVGKSRLAREAVERLGARDVAWVDAHDLEAVGGLLDWARQHPGGVVVIDGADRVPTLGVAAFDELRRHVPHLGILVTSRTRLAVAATIEALEPLGLPPEGADDAVLEAAESVLALRAALAEVAPGARIGSSDAARIARRAGGLPLALRLAAEAARALPASALVERATAAAADEIEDAVIAVLGTTSGAAAKAFAELSPVATGFDADLAARVTTLAPDEIEDVLIELVDHGLVVAIPDRRPPYSMLDPIAEVAARRLAARRDRDDVETRLIDACTARARALDLRAGPDLDALAERVATDLPLARRALAHAAAIGDGERALGLACRLEAPLYVLGWWAEKVELFDAALAVRGGPAALRARAHALRARAGPMHRFDLEHAERAEALAVEVGDDLLLAFTRSVRAVGLWWSGDTDASLRSSRDAAERFASAGRRLEWSEAWKFHGVALVASGDANRGVAVQREALDAARSVVGAAFPTAHGLAYLGHTHRMLGDDDAALACWAEALDICRRIGNRGTAIHIAIGLADLFAERGTVDRALEHLGVALDLIDASRAETYITWAWTVAVRAHATTGDTTEAIASARRALAAAHRVPPGEGRRLAIELADLALGLDDASTAARLLGVVDATPDVREMPFPPHSEAARVDALGRAVAARGGEDQRAAGRRRSLAEAAGALLVERAPRRDDDVTRRT